MNRCVWREKCLEYGGKKSEVDKKINSEKDINSAEKKISECECFGSVVLTTRLVKKNNKQKTINKVWV